MGSQPLSTIMMMLLLITSFIFFGYSVSARDCNAPPSVTGPCKAAFRRFTYDRGVCKELLYGGCGATRNLFITLEECQQFCTGIRGQQSNGFGSDSQFFVQNNNQIQDQFVDQRCSAPPFLYGSCSAELSRWSFYRATRSCHHYFYSGCSEGLAQNRFSSLQECVNTCQK